MPTEEQNPQIPAPSVKADGAIDKVIDRINDADSILVTLSKDPTVDEMTAALGLTLMLDKMGKHATAIYSGKTPNALEFLKPDETFEADTNSLQDFIIALDKEKADHLRYKIEGDFVKVYITPYKTTITEKDLEFSRGEVNVDLVIALDVVEAEDLDAALATHGRIMHNASLINISNSAPGRLGGVEWSDPRASSVSEMVVALFDQMGEQIPKEIATALLTGIVAATERFSNERTTPDTMALASKLMQLGADQQLIVAQMMSAKEDEPSKEEPKGEEDSWLEPIAEPKPAEKTEDGMLDVVHEDEVPKESELSPEQQLEQMIAGNTEQNANSGPLMKELEEAAKTEAEPTQEPVPESAPAPEPAPAPVDFKVEPPKVEEPEELPTLTVPGVSEFAPVAHEVMPEQPDTQVVAAVPQSKVPVASIYESDVDRVAMQDKTMTPLPEEKPKDYGAMMDAALAEPIENPALNPAMMAAPTVAAAPEAPAVAQQVISTPEVQQQDLNAMVNQMVNQAQQQGMPVGMSGGVELPPPPAPDTTNMMPPLPSLPPVQMPQPEAPQQMPQQPPMPQQPAVPQPEAQDDSAASLIPTAPDGVQVQAEPVNPVVVQPDQGPAQVQPVQDPSAFKIPGM